MDALDSTTSPDLALGAVREPGPGDVRPDAMPWLRQVPLARWRVRRELPELVAPQRVPPGARVLTVIRELGRALGAWALTGRRRGGSESKRDLSRRLRIAAERLGPTYIK